MHTGRPELDVDFVRDQFPALGEDWAFMDNAGGSVPAAQVVDAVAAYMCQFGHQLGASYPRSREAGERVMAGKAAIARLFGAAPEEVVLNASTTSNVYVLAHALGDTLKPGDEVVVTELDHEANVGAWRRLEARGAVVKEWRFDRETCALRVEDLEPLLGERTRFVAMTHCPNVTGVFQPVAEAALLVHAAGARLCVDGVAYAPHRRVDVKALGADVYLASLYKVYGPHLGFMYVAPDFLAEVRNQNHFFVGEDTAYKLEPGNVNHELTAGLSGIERYLAAVWAHHGGSTDTGDWRDRVFDLFADHEARMAERILGFLRDHPRVRVIGDARSDRNLRAPTIAFTVEGRSSEAIPAALDGRQIAIRFGDFYARRAMEGMGLMERSGVVRISLVHYNSHAEVERLLAALDDVL